VDHVSSAIETGEIAQGDRLPSRSDLAERFGVHPTTVGLAMKILGEKYPLEFLPGKGAFLGPSRAKTRTPTLGVIGLFPSQIPEHGLGLEETYDGAVLRGLLLAAEEELCSVVYIPGSSALPLDIDRIAAQGADSLFVFGLPKDPEMIAEFRRRGIPLILDMPGDGRASAHGASVVCEDVDGVFREVVNLFRSRGHRRIACVTRDSIDHSGPRWRDAFYAECVAAGLGGVSPDSFKLFGLEETGCDWPAILAREVLAALDGPQPPTAFFIRAAPPVLKDLFAALRDRGLTIGRDVSLVCDIMPAAEAATPVSAFVHDYREWTRAVIRTARQLLDEPWRVVRRDIPFRFVDRGSIAVLEDRPA